MERDKQTTVAFVLSGGASLGAIQVRMPALYEREITPDVIVGTSAGALNGAFIASRPPDHRDRGRPRGGLGRPASRADVPAQSAHRAARLPLLPRPPLPESGLRRLIYQHVERQELERMPIPCTWSPWT
jgi:NTE family protein